jgi:AraC-like DNA-binding protein
MLLLMAMVFPVLLPQITTLPFYVYSVGIEHNQEPVSRPNGYPHYQWLQVRSGEGELKTADGKFALAPDSGYFLFPNEFHAYRQSGTKDLVVDWISFDGAGVETLFSSGPITKSGVYLTLRFPEIRQALRDIYENGVTGGLRQGYENSGLLYQALLALLSSASEPGKESSETGYLRLRPVLDFMDRHITETITVESLSDIIKVSPAHLCRLFQQQLGKSPLAYLIELRLKRARNLLLTQPGLRVNEVALMVGYEDENYFSRLFRSRVGMSPRAFRELHGY